MNTFTSELIYAANVRGFIWAGYIYYMSNLLHIDLIYGMFIFSILKCLPIHKMYTVNQAPC